MSDGYPSPPLFVLEAFWPFVAIVPQLSPDVPKLKTSRRLMSARNVTPQAPVRWSTFATTCLVSRHLGKVTVERRRVPDAVMYEANGLETLFFSGYDLPCAPSTGEFYRSS